MSQWQMRIMPRVNSRIIPRSGCGTAVGASGDARPSGAYAMSWTTDPITDLNQTNGTVAVTGCEVGGQYKLTVSGSGAAPIVIETAVPSIDFSVAGIDCSDFDNGPILAQFEAQIFLDGAWTWAKKVNDTATKSVAPEMVNFTFPFDATSQTGSFYSEGTGGQVDWGDGLGKVVFDSVGAWHNVDYGEPRADKVVKIWFDTLASLADFRFSESGVTGAFPDFSTASFLGGYDSRLDLSDNDISNPICDIGSTSLRDLLVSNNPQLNTYDGTVFPDTLSHVEIQGCNFSADQFDNVSVALLEAGNTNGIFFCQDNLEGVTADSVPLFRRLAGRNWHIKYSGDLFWDRGNLKGEPNTMGAGWTKNADGTYTCDGSQTGSSNVDWWDVLQLGREFILLIEVLEHTSGAVSLASASLGTGDKTDSGLYGTSGAADGPSVSMGATPNFVGIVRVSAITDVIAHMEFDGNSDDSLGLVAVASENNVNYATPGEAVFNGVDSEVVYDLPIEWPVSAQMIVGITQASTDGVIWSGGDNYLLFFQDGYLVAQSEASSARTARSDDVMADGEHEIIIVIETNNDVPDLYIDRVKQDFGPFNDYWGSDEHALGCRDAGGTSRHHVVAFRDLKYYGYAYDGELAPEGQLPGPPGIGS